MNNRILLLDYARIGAAFLVIFGHLYDPSPENVVRTFIYQFHMPLFFVVSGMLHRPKSVGFLAKKLLWPVFIFVWFYYLLCYPIYHFHVWEGATVAQMADFPTFLWLTCCNLPGYFLNNKGLGPSWFLIVLFYLKVACGLAERCGNIFSKYGRVVSACCEGTVLIGLWGLMFWLPEAYGNSCGYHVWRNVGYVGNAAMAMPYYLIGRWAMRHLFRVNAWFSVHFPQTVLCAASFAAVVAAAVYYNGGTSMFCILLGHRPFPYNLLWCYAAGLSGTCMVLWVCMLLPQKLQGFWQRTVHVSATSLMGVVGFQYFPLKHI